MEPGTATQRSRNGTAVTASPGLSLETLPARTETQDIYLIVKRCLDFFLALVGLVLTAPLWLLIAAAIKLEDGGPILFLQDRPGKDGERFSSYKFRSMKVGASEQDLSVAATEDDPRVTTVGRILRATAADEIPQLWNILKGDMSFVGPRALPVAEVRGSSDDVEVLADVPGFDQRQSVRPGLTGLAQVAASRDIDTRDKFRYDVLYIENQSIWLDLKLITVSIWYSVTGQWGD